MAELNIKKTKKKASKKPNTGKVVVLPIYNRGQYKIVTSDAKNIEPSSAETRSEDKILDPHKRARLEDITRNLVRNSSLFNTILGSLTTNVVSTCGGKVVLSIPNEQANDSIKYSFKNYTRNVDFTTGDCLNKFLKRVLREYIIGGDCVFIFDDGLIEDSGKVLFFESSELVNVPQVEVEKRFGKGSTISQGKVYSKNGRHIGTVVSRSQKGCQGDADPDKCYFLKKDPNGNPMENYWFQLSNNWREGRGVSQAASAIATIHQIEDLVSSELLSARRQAQIFCWLTESPEHPEQELPSPFGVDYDPASMTDEQIREAVKAQLGECDEGQVSTISFDRAKESQIVYEQLPQGISAQQLQTTHPNQNVQTMVDWLANRAASTLGLSRVFAVGNPTDADWRAQQLFSWPAITEFQKTLETLLDWILNCYVKWAKKTGSIKAYVSEDFLDYVDWSWTSMDELNEVTHQTGLKMGLENCTKTYKEILGNDWKEKLEQVAFERKWMAEHNITHPAEKLISGGETQASKNLSDGSVTQEMNPEGFKVGIIKKVDSQG